MSWNFKEYLAIVLSGLCRATLQGRCAFVALHGDSAYELSCETDVYNDHRFKGILPSRTNSFRMELGACHKNPKHEMPYLNQHIGSNAWLN